MTRKVTSIDDLPPIEHADGQVAEWAADDEDLDSIRDRPDFKRLATPR